MEIVVSQRNGRVPVTIFEVQGEITGESYEELEQQAQEAFEAGTQNLVLDLTQVAFLSSLGLRAIHQIFMLFRSDSVEESDEAVRKGLSAGTYRAEHFKLVHPTRNVLKTLKLAGYDMFLEIHPDVERAVASF